MMKESPYLYAEKTFEDLRDLTPRDRDYLALLHFGETHSPYGNTREKGADVWKVIHEQQRKAEEFFPLPYIPSEDELEAYLDAYSTAMVWQVRQVEFLDRIYGDLCPNASDDTGIVLVADHGESWDIRYAFGHGYSYTLKPDALHVPLLTNIQSSADLTKITSTKEIYRIILREALEQGQAEAFFYAQGKESSASSKVTSIDNRVLIDERGWHYARRFDGIPQGSTRIEGDGEFYYLINELIKRTVEKL